MAFTLHPITKQVFFADIDFHINRRIRNLSGFLECHLSFILKITLQAHSKAKHLCHMSYFSLLLKELAYIELYDIKKVLKVHLQLGFDFAANVQELHVTKYKNLAIN